MCGVLLAFMSSSMHSRKSWKLRRVWICKGPTQARMRRGAPLAAAGKMDFKDGATL